MVTRAVLPLKLSALPKRPWFVQAAVPIWPLLPEPEASAALAPDPSSNPNAATKPDGGGDPGTNVAV